MKRRSARRACSLSAAILTLLFAVPKAHATYSLVAVDSQSGEIGGFAVSCIGTELSLSEILSVSPGFGIVAAQGYFFEGGRDQLVLNLEAGRAPSEAISRALSPELDPPTSGGGPAFRQYAVVSVDGASAQHSGASLDAAYAHLSGRIDTITYTIQGNVLSSSVLIEVLEREFKDADGTIGARLPATLLAAKESGHGDARCAPRSGDAGYLALKIGDEPLLEVEIVQPEGEVAEVLALRTLDLLPPSVKDPASPRESEDGATSPPSDGGRGCAVGAQRKQAAPWLFVVVLLSFFIRRKARGFPLS